MQRKNTAPEPYDANLIVAIRQLSQSVTDLERVRIAQGNRVQFITTKQPSKKEDGSMWGLGLSTDISDPANRNTAEAVAAIIASQEGLRALEEQAIKDLERVLKKHPLYPWIKAQSGLGDKTVGRLLGALHGDPYWNAAEHRPRRVSDLWSYCGYAVTPEGLAPRRTKGQLGGWSPEAKMRVFLIAESCVKQLRKPCSKDEESGVVEHVYGCGCGGFRLVYDEARAKYRDSVHQQPCVRCGPAGKPAPAGSELKLGHQHARAMRAVSKEVLRGLWVEAKRLHDAGLMTPPPEAIS